MHRLSGRMHKKLVTQGAAGVGPGVGTWGVRGGKIIYFFTYALFSFFSLVLCVYIYYNTCIIYTYIYIYISHSRKHMHIAYVCVHMYPHTHIYMYCLLKKINVVSKNRVSKQRPYSSWFSIALDG